MQSKAFEKSIKTALQHKRFLAFPAIPQLNALTPTGYSIGGYVLLLQTFLKITKRIFIAEVIYCNVGPELKVNFSAQIVLGTIQNF